MPEQLASTLERLDSTLAGLDETLRTTRDAAAKAAADSAWAAERISKERWWRRATTIALLLVAALASVGIVDTRMDAERAKSRAASEAFAACLRANEGRTNNREAIVTALETIAALPGDSTPETEEREVIRTVEDAVAREIPLRECE